MRLTRPLFLLRDAARVRGVPTGGTETASEQTRARRVPGEPPKRGKEETIDGWVPRTGRAEGVGSSLDDDDDADSDSVSDTTDDEESAAAEKRPDVEMA